MFIFDTIVLPILQLLLSFLNTPGKLDVLHQPSIYSSPIESRLSSTEGIILDYCQKQITFWGKEIVIPFHSNLSICYTRCFYFRETVSQCFYIHHVAFALSY